MSLKVKYLDYSWYYTHYEARDLVPTSKSEIFTLLNFQIKVFSSYITHYKHKTSFFQGKYEHWQFKFEGLQNFLKYVCCKPVTVFITTSTSTHLICVCIQLNNQKLFNTKKGIP